MYFHAIQENLSLPVNEERWISIGRNTNQCEFDVEIVTTIMAIVMLAEVYLITPKILQVLKTQDGAKVKEQFLRMVHSLFLQVATMSHLSSIETRIYCKNGLLCSIHVSIFKVEIQ